MPYYNDTKIINQICRFETDKNVDLFIYFFWFDWFEIIIVWNKASYRIKKKKSVLLLLYSYEIYFCFFIYFHPYPHFRKRKSNIMETNLSQFQTISLEEINKIKLMKRFDAKYIFHKNNLLPIFDYTRIFIVIIRVTKKCIFSDFS